MWTREDGRARIATIDYQFPNVIEGTGAAVDTAWRYRGRNAYDESMVNALAQWNPIAASGNADNYALYALCK